MCGITGWVDFDSDLIQSNHILEKMNRSLAHRGPDDQGYWLSEHAALAHCRLVVVDPEGGRQPMIRLKAGNKYVITYNGELYNTLELRRELESLGNIFLSQNSDTEALLLAYMQWGPECLRRLNGIFAFGIWDESNQSLFLARDRLGVKPLFYCQRSHSFLFGSEPKALLANPSVQPEIDGEGLAELFVMGPSRTPGHGIFKEMYEVKPGYYLTFDRDGIKNHKYWGLESYAHMDSLEETAATLGNLFKDVVARQLIADRPVATLLSGGLDSSAITALASQSFKMEGLEPLTTFSVDYRDNDINFRASSFQPDPDWPWIKQVSEFIGSNHHYVTIENDELADALEPALVSNDYPGMADIDSSLYLFCREIKRTHTVGLSGECADEILGGYPWFREVSPEHKTFPWIRMLKERMEFLSPEIVKQMKPIQYLGDRYRQALSEVPVFSDDDPEEARKRELLYLNITRFMPTLLDRKDRMSMAWGLEIRVPFADHRLVQYIWNIPWSFKSCDGMLKGIMRRSLRGILPAEVLNRKKSPYPKTHSPIYLAKVREKALNLLSDSASPLKDLIKTDLVRYTITSGQGLFDVPFFGQLMGDPQYLAYLIQMDFWLRKYKVKIRL
ncbi:MAG: asparagine synthase (glutamine-hydrolyzing) [Chitinophagales bacterium]